MSKTQSFRRTASRPSLLVQLLLGNEDAVVDQAMDGLVEHLSAMLSSPLTTVVVFDHRKDCQYMRSIDTEEVVGRSRKGGVLTWDSSSVYLASAKIETSNKNYGMIAVRSISPLDTKDQFLLDLLADYLASQAELAEVHQRQTALARAIREIDTKRIEASKTGDEQLLLRAIVDEARLLFAADVAVLYEYAQPIKDVKLPPIMSGEFYHKSVVEGRSINRPHSDSVVVRLIERGGPVFASNGLDDWVESGLLSIDSSAGRPHFLSREKVESSCGVPLQLENEIVGVLFLNFRRPTRFSAKLQAIISGYCHQAALAIGSERFSTRSFTLGRKLEVLSDIGRELSLSVVLDAREVGEKIYTQASRVLDTSNFFVALFDRNSDRFSLVFLQDDNNTIAELEPHLSRGLTGHVFREERSFLLTCEDQKEFFSNGMAELVGEPSLCWMGAPMIVRNECVGVMAAQSYESREAYSVHDLHLLASIASQAAVAVYCGSLLEDLRRKMIESEALASLTGVPVLGGSESLVSVLTEALNKLNKLAAAQDSFVVVGKNEKGRLLPVMAATGVLKSLFENSISIPDELRRTDCAWLSQKAIKIHVGKEEEGSVSHFLCLRLDRRLADRGFVALSYESVGDRPSKSLEDALRTVASQILLLVDSVDAGVFRRALIRSVPDPVIATNSRGAITELNAAASELLEYELEEIRGLSVDRLYWNGLEEARQIGHILASKESIRQILTYARSKSGDRIPLHLSASVLRDGGGRMLGSVGVLKDLRLRSVTGKIRHLLDAISDVSAAADIETVLLYCLEYAVPLADADAGFIAYGKTEEDLKWYQTGCEVREEELARTLYKAWRSDNDHRQDSEVPPGAKLLDEAVSHREFILSVQARNVGVLILESKNGHQFDGVTDLVDLLAKQCALSLNRLALLEDRLRTTEQLLLYANSLAVAQVATSFLHEAKNSLHGMTLTVGNVMNELERHCESRKAPALVSRLATIEDKISRFDSLSRRLSGFSTRGLKPELSMAFMNDVVRAAIVLVASAMEEKRITLDLQLAQKLDKPSKGRGYSIEVDTGQIEQALMNLLLNAVAYSSKRGRIVVSSKIESSDKLVVVNVQDFGSGIKAEDRSEVFKAFFTRRPGGTGLGLYISRKLVDINNGQLSFHSAEAKGSTFTIRLPLAH